MTPHILFLILDAVRYDRLALTAEGPSAMPGLQKLGEQSRVYTQAFCNAPWTLPSHASFFSGLTPSQHGATQQTLRMRATCPHLAEILRDRAHYHTHLFAANDWFAAETGLARGFEHVVGNPVHQSKRLQRRWRNLTAKMRMRLRRDGQLSLTQRLVAAMLRTLDEAAGDDRPHFLFANLMDAHLPLRPSARAVAAFFPDATEAAAARRLALPAVEHRHVAGTRVLSGRELSLLSRLYEAALLDLDVALAPLFRRLRQADLRGKVMVIVAADHGENLGEHGLLGHQFSVHETLIHVPLLMHWPGVLEPAQVDDLVQLSDLFPTILARTSLNLAAIGANPALDLLAASGQDAPERKAVIVEYARPLMSLATIRRHQPAPERLAQLDRSLTAVRTPTYKYIVAAGVGEEEFLFSLATDPGETRNLAAEAPPTLQRLREHLQTWREQIAGDAQDDSPARLDDMDEAVRQRLQELGYL